MDSNKKTKWIPTDKRFVAFLDLLGFKDKVMRSTHEEIYEELHKISTVSRNLEESTKNDSIQKTFNDADIYIVSFSDSIVLFSKNDNIDNFKFFSLALLALFSKAIKNKIAIKGAVAHGLVSLNKSEQIYFGQPIIDAFLLEEDVNFIGVLCHNSIDKYLKSDKFIKSIADKEFINLTYKFAETPLKYGNINHYFLDYYQYLLNSDQKKEGVDASEKVANIINVFNEFFITVSGNPRRYVDNTIEFVHKINKENKLQLYVPEIK